MDANCITELAALLGSPIDKRPRDLHVRCPFGIYHSKGVDTSQSLSVKIAPGMTSGAYCFSCGAQGSLLGVFTAAFESVDDTLGDAVEYIRAHDGASLSVALATLKVASASSLVEETPVTDWAKYASQCARQVPAYLVERGIVQSDVQRWMLGYDSRMQRAVFPVRDDTGKIVGCLRRAVLPGVKPPYMDTPGAYVWKKTVFFGEHRVDRTCDTAYLVEGPMDTIFAARAFPNVLGMMGAKTGVGAARLEKLQRWGVRKLVLIFDPDRAGQEAVYGGVNAHGDKFDGLRDKLRRHFVIKVATLPMGEDPASIPSSVLLQAVAAATYLEAKRPLTGQPTRPKLGHGKQPINQSENIADYLAKRKHT